MGETNNGHHVSNALSVRWSTPRVTATMTEIGHLDAHFSSCNDIGLVDLGRQLGGDGFKPVAQIEVVASGPFVDQCPSVVYIVRDGTSWAPVVAVADERGVDVLCLRDVDPDPDRGEDALSIARVMASLRNLAIGALRRAGRTDITDATRWPAAT